MNRESINSEPGGRSGPRVLIIGAGFGGLCMAMSLKRAGFDDFTILEKANDIGGTWRGPRQPGIGGAYRHK